MRRNPLPDEHPRIPTLIKNGVNSVRCKACRARLGGDLILDRTVNPGRFPGWGISTAAPSEPRTPNKECWARDRRGNYQAFNN